MAANNTNEQCQTICMQQGYALAGTEYRMFLSERKQTTLHLRRD